MPSHSQHPVLAIIDQVIADFDGSGIYSAGCAGALNAMRPHWAARLTPCHSATHLINDDLAETQQRLEIMRAEILRRLDAETSNEASDLLPFDASTPTDPWILVQQVASLCADLDGTSEGAALTSPALEPSNLIGQISKQARAMLAERARREAPALLPDHPEKSGSDFILRADAKSAWVTVDNLSIHIIRHGDGVEIMTHPKGCEDQDLEDSYTYFDTAEDALVDFHDVDIDDVAEWVGLHYRRNFEAETIAARHDWIRRYIETHTSSACGSTIES